MPLDVEQQRRVEEMLRRRNFVCPQCGSPDFASNGLAMQNTGSISVGVYCNNSDSIHVNGFQDSPSPTLTEEEAREVGIPLKGSSSSLRRPGETFPQ